MSKPQAGQWWQYGKMRRLVLAFTTVGDVVYQHNKLGDVSSLSLEEFLVDAEHLPDCTGWDWQEETFPQYWTTLDTKGSDVAFVKRASKDSWFAVHKDGSDGPDMNDISPWSDKYRTRLTESEALALLDKPQPPAESPDDWVVLDPVEYADHMPRDGVDWFFNSKSWEVHERKHCRSTVGEFARVSDESRVRCRRRDLPAKEPAKRRVSVPMWLVTNKENGVQCILHQSPAPKYPESHTVEPAGTFEVEVG